MRIARFSTAWACATGIQRPSSCDELADVGRSCVRPNHQQGQWVLQHPQFPEDWMAAGAPNDHNVSHDLVLMMHRCQGYWVGSGDVPEETYGPPPAQS